MRAALLLSTVALAGCGLLDREVTYHADVQPLLADHCVRCHQPGGLGTGDFTDPDVVVAFADRIAARTEAGTMPLPTSDPECRPFIGHEHLTLDNKERGILARWAEKGAPLGDPADAPDHLGHQAGELENPDVVATIPRYTPTFQDPGNPGNEYRCFALDPGHEADFFVTGLHPIIDEPALVHHIVIGAVKRGSFDPDALGDQGVDCINDDMGTVENMLAAWAPGSEPQVFADGAGMRVAADEVLMIQMHYYDNGEQDGLSDASGYAMTTAAAVDTELVVLPLGSFTFRIPAGAPAYTFEDQIRADRDLRIHGVFPHMHVLGAAYHMAVDRKKDACLVSSEVYSFDNQLTYLFEEPVDVAAGETIRWECTWNNSTSNPHRIYDEPRETFYGERTDQEMCFFFTLVEAE